MPSVRRTRVAWMSDSPALATGYGRVTREILKRVKRDSRYELVCIGWGHPDGSPLRADYAFEVKPGGSDFGRAALTHLPVSDRPDVLVTLGNLWMISWVKDWLPSNTRATSWIGC